MNSKFVSYTTNSLIMSRSFPVRLKKHISRARPSSQPSSRIAILQLIYINYITTSCNHPILSISRTHLLPPFKYTNLLLRTIKPQNLAVPLYHRVHTHLRDIRLENPLSRAAEGASALIARSESGRRSRPCQALHVYT